MPFVFAAVLFAALCHAGWNAAVKRGLDPLATTVLMSIGAALVGLAMLPFTGLPENAAWPWVIASVLIHIVYFAALIESYAAGDMGLVYPLARGSAPLMTATATAALLDEHLGLFGWLGIAVLAAGVLLLSLRGSRDLAKLDRRAIGFALLTAVTICAYTVVDGIGARARRQRARLYRRACSSASACRWRSMRWCGAGAEVFAADGAALEHRSRRRRHAGHLLRHRDLGDDGRADRARGRRCARPACCSARSWRSCS